MAKDKKPPRQKKLFKEKTIKAVQDAADTYVEADAALTNARRAQVNAKDAMIMTMNKFGVTGHDTSDGRWVRIDSRQQVSIVDKPKT